MKSIHIEGSSETIIILNSIIPETATGGDKISLYVTEEGCHKNKYDNPYYNKGVFF